MNVVLIYGSPHRHGRTRFLTDAFLNTLPKECRVTEFSAYDMSAAPCTDCGVCAETDTCVFNDMDELAECLITADMVVIASPVYFLSVPAPLKAMFDRFQRFYTANKQARSRFSGKERTAVLLLTAGAPSEKGAIVAQQLRWLLPCIGAQLEKTVVCADCDRMTDRQFADRVAEPLLQ